MEFVPSPQKKKKKKKKWKIDERGKMQRAKKRYQ
jgi:hypothetical protein